MKAKGAKEQFGITVKVDKKLDKLSKKTLFPDRMKKVNDFLAGLHSK